MALMSKTTLAQRLKEEVPALIVTSTAAGGVGLIVGDALTHVTGMAGTHVAIGAILNGTVYLFNNKYRNQVKRFFMGMGFIPKLVRKISLADAMFLVNFFLKDHKQIEEFRWSMPVYLDSNEDFVEQYGDSILDVYEAVPLIAAAGGRVCIIGVPPARRAMSMMVNATNALGGSSMAEFLRLTKEKAELQKPIMVIRWRSGLTAVLDQLVFKGAMRYTTRYGSSKGDVGHVEQVCEDFDVLKKQCKPFQPMPDLMPPARRRRSKKSS